MLKKPLIALFAFVIAFTAYLVLCHVGARLIGAPLKGLAYDITLVFATLLATLFSLFAVYERDRHA